jgi:outer membrane immunogenic protein
MKSLAIIGAVGALGLAVPLAAHAQSASMFQPITGYGSIGYAGAQSDGVDLGAIQGRLGARFGRYFGLEGELSGGVKSDSVTNSGITTDVKLRNQEAAYVVGFLPLTPKFDLIGRVGYGGTSLRLKTLGVSSTDTEESWNFGAGAQYVFDGKNGVRLDYTRHDFEHGPATADVWSVGYVRNF